jgi:hypothetical protein
VYDAAILTCAVIGTIAAILMVLPLFGVDLRLRRRSELSAEISASPKGRREKRLWAAVVLTVASVVLSGASFYRLERPRVVQKIIEKPVDRIVEKVIPAKCPAVPTSAKTSGKGKPDSAQPPKANNSLQHPETVINASQGIGISGGIVSNPTVNNLGLPDRHLLPEQRNAIIVSLKDKPCKIIMGALTNVEDAMKYAAELRNAFRAGGCVVQDFMPIVINSEGGWYGVKVIYHDETEHAEGEAVYTNPNTPQGIVFSALDHAHIDALAGDGTIVPPGEVLVVVGRQRK